MLNYSNNWTAHLLPSSGREGKFLLIMQGNVVEALHAGSQVITSSDRFPTQVICFVLFF